MNVNLNVVGLCHLFMTEAKLRHATIYNCPRSLVTHHTELFAFFDIGCKKDMPQTKRRMQKIKQKQNLLQLASGTAPFSSYSKIFYGVEHFAHLLMEKLRCSQRQVILKAQMMRGLILRSLTPTSQILV